MSHIVITGASSGLGAALARRYAAPGVVLGLIGRSAERLAPVVAACEAAGAQVETGEMDVADADAVAGWVQAFDARHPIDTVIANAGVSAGPAPGARVEGYASIHRQIATNLLGVAATVEAALPAMIARKRGRIAVIASIAGLRGLPYSPGYSASKAGARAYGEAMRGLLRGSGVSLTVVCPGFFTSAMTERWNGSTPFLRSADWVATSVHRAVERGSARWSWPWPLVLGLRAADLFPPLFTDPILRDFHFHISPDDKA